MKKLMCVFWGVVLLAGCAGTARVPPSSEDGIKVQMSHQMAFEKIKDMLKERGYTLAIADERYGVIETLPKEIEGEEGNVQHKVLLSFLLRGDRSSTNVYMRFIVTSDFPDERKRIMEMLKSISP